MKLSIITINRNNAKGLRKTMESVLSQTFRDFEYIIVDGASTDESICVIKDMVPERDMNISGIHVRWVSEPDKGIYNAMNKGIKMAKGDYCLFLNSGDWLIDEAVLGKVFSCNVNEDIVSGRVFYTFPKGAVPSELRGTITFRTFYESTILHSGASFIKRLVFDKYGLYDENLKICSDWKLFLMSIVFGSATFREIDCFVSYYDVTGISETQLDLAYTERMETLQQLLPNLVLKDYENLLAYKKNMLNEARQVRRTYAYRLGAALLKPIKIFRRKL